MESILVWTLIIAAAAIVAMLVLLIASERDIKRKSAEIDSLRGKLKQAELALQGPSPALLEGAGVSAEVAALTEQVRSNEIAIATMQCELEALRAENSWLKQESGGYPAKSPDLQTRAPESLPPSRAEESNARIADYRLDLPPQKSRLMFPVAGFAFFIIALVSVYFARDWQNTTVPPAHRGASRSEERPNQSPAPDSLITASSAGSATLNTYESTEQKPLPARKNPASGASYEVIRSTRLFSEPTESSRPLARVEAGMEINVVGARDGWLEVRSRHGRPPGFIRKDAAMLRRAR